MSFRTAIFRRADALDGPELIASAPSAAVAEVKVGLRARNVAGMPIIEVDTPTAGG